MINPSPNVNPYHMPKTKFPIQPVGNKILVLPIPMEDEEINGIIIPGVANSQLSKAKIVSVSSELAHIYKEADIILYSSKSGVGTLINGVPHLWLQDHEIWGIINE